MPDAKSLRDLVGEPVLAGLWLRSAASPWYSRYVGPASIPVFVLLAVAAMCSRLTPPRRNKTELKLEHSGSIYCARTRDHLYLIASSDDAQLMRVLRRFPYSSLVSCSPEHPQSTSVEFQFDSNDNFTLHFNGSDNEFAALADLCNPPND